MNIESKATFAEYLSLLAEGDKQVEILLNTGLRVTGVIRVHADFVLLASSAYPVGAISGAWAAHGAP